VDTFLSPGPVQSDEIPAATSARPLFELFKSAVKACHSDKSRIENDIKRRRAGGDRKRQSIWVELICSLAKKMTVKCFVKACTQVHNIGEIMGDAMKRTATLKGLRKVVTRTGVFVTEAVWKEIRGAAEIG